MAVMDVITAGLSQDPDLCSLQFKDSENESKRFIICEFCQHEQGYHTKAFDYNAYVKISMIAPEFPVKAVIC